MKCTQTHSWLNWIAGLLCSHIFPFLHGHFPLPPRHQGAPGCASFAHIYSFSWVNNRLAKHVHLFCNILLRTGEAHLIHCTSPLHVFWGDLGSLKYCFNLFICIVKFRKPMESKRESQHTFIHSYTRSASTHVLVHTQRDILQKSLFVALSV